MRHHTINKGRHGTTLIEVMMAVLITFFVGISIVASMAYGVQVQQRTREYNAASRIAQGMMETAKRQFFLNLERQDLDGVLMDNRGTTRTTDDIFCDITLRFFNTAGTEVGIDGSPMPLDRTMIRAEASVTWTPIGLRRDPPPLTYTVTTLIAP